jgi:DNA-binding LacI/PurR family transcriptional regulator
MTKAEFSELVKNMGGHAAFANKIGSSTKTVSNMLRNGYIANTWRGAVMIAAQKDGYKVKITDINKVMT